MVDAPRVVVPGVGLHHHAKGAGGLAVGGAQVAVAKGDVLDVATVRQVAELVNGDGVADSVGVGIDSGRRDVAGALDLAATENDIADVTLRAAQVEHGAVHAFGRAAAVVAEDRAAGVGRVRHRASPYGADLELFNAVGRGKDHLALEPRDVTVAADPDTARQRDGGRAGVRAGGQVDGTTHLCRLAQSTLQRRGVVAGAVAGGAVGLDVEERAGS